MKLIYVSIIIFAFAIDLNSQFTCEAISGIKKSSRIQCGSIRVLEDHERKDSRLLQLAYVVIKSGKKTENAPMIFISGGPGSPCLSSDFINYWLDSPITKSRDVILFDQRGTGFSSLLPSLEDEFYGILAADLSFKQENAAVATVIDHLKEKVGNKDLSKYNSFQSTRDIYELMVHLGYGKYHLFGSSYGGRLATLLQFRFPELINAVLLDSPSVLGEAFLLDRMKNYALVVAALMQDCRENEDCHASYPNLKEKYFLLLARLKKQAVSITTDQGPFVVNAQDAMYFIRKLLYGADALVKVPQLIHELLEGGQGQLIKDLIENDFQTQFNYTMWMCVEKYESHTNQSTLRDIEHEYSSNQWLPAKLGMFTSVYLNLEKLHKGSWVDKNNKGTSVIPTLLLINRYDPVTPPTNGYALLGQLSLGQLYVSDSYGHGGGNWDCKMRLFQEFMNHPKDILGTSCLNLYQSKKTKK